MRGYLTHAFNSSDVDYLRMAYCLALSLSLTQSKVSRLSVVVPEGQPMPDHYRRVFDEVIAIPDERPDYIQNSWRVDNFLKFDALTPYRETVTLDADTLFFEDHSGWWDVIGERDVVGATAVTYRDEPITFNSLRQDFYDVGLPDLHNGFFYFRSGAVATRLFSVMRDNAQDWSGTMRRHFGRPDVHFSSDCALLTALRDCELEHEAHSPVPGVPRFVHMKACLQGWQGIASDARDWRPYADYAFDDDMRLRVDGLLIRLPFHYHVRSFITDKLLAAYEYKTGNM